MANVDLTLKLIQERRPITGVQVAQLQLSLKTLEQAGWTYDVMTGTLNPPKQGGSK